MATSQAAPALARSSVRTGRGMTDALGAQGPALNAPALASGPHCFDNLEAGFSH